MLKHVPKLAPKWVNVLHYIKAICIFSVVFDFIESGPWSWVNGVSNKVTFPYRARWPSGGPPSPVLG